MAREKWKYQGVERRGSDGFRYHVWHCEDRAIGSGWIYMWAVHQYRAATTGGRA